MCAELKKLEGIRALESPASLQHAPAASSPAAPAAAPACACAAGRTHLSAADAMSCRPCGNCGELRPPDSVAQATACVRDELRLPPTIGPAGAAERPTTRSASPKP